MNELIHLFSISDLLKQFPENLSGGEKQKVAIVRSLIRNPDLLLLDEPFSAVDFQQRKELQDALLQVHQKLKFTALVISHDIEEVVRLSDNIFMLDKGKVIKNGPALALFENKEEDTTISLTGIVVSVEQLGRNQKIRILVGNEIHAIEKDNSMHQIGDRIIVEMKKK
jgi:molybdate transport system ATP-binding protein